MSDVKAKIESRLSDMVNAVNRSEFDIFANYHTENCTVMIQDDQTRTGRQAIKDFAETFLKNHSITRVAMNELNYFEALDDNSAFTTFYISLSNQTEDVARVRINAVWKRQEDEWLIDRKFENFPELSKRDLAFKEIESQMIKLYDAFTRMDIKGALEIYADEPTWLFQGQENIRGKKDGYEAFNKLIPQMKTLIMDEIFYFEVFGDDTAITNAYVDLIDENGKKFNRIRDFFVWKKQGGVWRILRDSYNELPLK